MTLENHFTPADGQHTMRVVEDVRGLSRQHVAREHRDICDLARCELAFHALKLLREGAIFGIDLKGFLMVTRSRASITVPLPVSRVSIE